MNEQLNLLISLQKIDSIMLSITEAIELLPDKLDKTKARLRESEASHEKIKSEYEKSDKEKKQKEDELEEIQDKLNKFKAKSAEIKTNKEYEAYLKEIETFEKTKYQVEDTILSVMETLDTLTKNLKMEEIKFKKVEEGFRQEEKALELEKNDLYSKLDKEKIKRKELAVRIDKGIYDEYMNLIRASGGLAVVQTENEICLGCHTNIPPQLYNDIKNSQDIFICYYCNRFLFYLAPGKTSRGEEEK